MFRIACLLAVTAALAGCQANWPGQKKKVVINYPNAILDARTTLRESADDPDAHVRTRALEALAATEGKSAGPIMLQLLRDDRAPVQFAAAMAIGDARYAPGKEPLQDLAREPEVPAKFMCAAIYTLHQLGDDEYTSLLGRYIQDEDKWVRATAAMVMGRMGDPSAIGPLKSLQRDDHDQDVSLQAVEALALLGDESSLFRLEAFTKSQFMEDRLTAVETLGRIPSARSSYVLHKLFEDSKQDPTIRVAAAGSLGMLRVFVSCDLCVKAIKDPDGVLRDYRGKGAEIRPAEVTTLQVMAVLALGHLGNMEMVAELQPLLTNARGAVRVAAAQAILLLLKHYEAPEVQPAPKAGGAAAIRSAAGAPTTLAPLNRPPPTKPIVSKMVASAPVAPTASAPAAPVPTIAPMAPVAPAPATPVTPVPSTEAAPKTAAPAAPPASAPATVIVPGDIEIPAAPAPAPAKLHAPGAKD